MCHHGLRGSRYCLPAWGLLLMTHWRQPRYTIETEFGTLRNVSQDDAEQFEHMNSDAPYKFTIQQPDPPYMHWWYFPSVVLATTVILLGIRFLIEG